MQIAIMDQHECKEMIVRTRLARLACAHNNQPYVSPIHCAYDNDYLYSFSTVGQKIHWLRTNPLVCVEAEEIKSTQEWATIIIQGTYQELPKTPDWKEHRDLAYRLLQRSPMWWEPGYVTVLEGSKLLELVYFRVRIDEISGRRGIP